MLTQVCAPAARVGIRTTGTEPIDTVRFCITAPSVFTIVSESNVFPPPDATVRFADAVWNAPQLTQVFVVTVTVAVVVVVDDTVTVPVVLVSLIVLCEVVLVAGAVAEVTTAVEVTVAVRVVVEVAEFCGNEDEDEPETVPLVA